MSSTFYKVISNFAAMYKSQSAMSGIVTILRKNTYIEVQDISNGFATCIYNDKYGYTHASKLRIVTGSVTIKYVNENNGSIRPDTVNNNLTLGAYTYSASEIFGYDFDGTSPLSGTLTIENLTPTITFKYKKKVGTVTVKYINVNNNTALAPEDFYNNLIIGTYSYTAKAFDKYTLIGELSQTATLTLDERTKLITFYYKDTITMSKS